MKNDNFRTPVLVIGYNRWDFLSKTLNSVAAAGPSKVYIVIDGPKSDSFEDQKQVIQCQVISKKFQEEFGIPTKFYFRKNNTGSAVNILSAIHWFFSQEEFGAIIEDDCIIEDTFIDYLNDFRNLLGKNRIRIISGFRPRLNIKPDNSIAFTHSPLTWGWATDRNSWNKMWNEIILLYYKNKIKNPGFKHSVFNYWKVGFQRSITRRNDAWDILLAFNMLIHDCLTVIPQKNLVRNIGTDERSSNTFKKDKLINISTSPYEKGSHKSRIDSQNIALNDEIIFKDLNSIKRIHSISPFIKDLFYFFKWNKSSSDLFVFVEKNSIPIID
jgi:hypothetical protein